MGGSVAEMKKNLTLVNSRWTADKARACYGDMEIKVLYPPVAGTFPDVPWEHKENGFVCIGRIAPEKEIDKIIGILGEVRAKGRDVHLHIIGSKENPDYYANIVRMAEANGLWITMDVDLPRDELAGLVALHRFGIHGTKEEHFGMAVAEMLQAGCIVFVPNGGGQQEIVAPCDYLTYRSHEDAVTKILQVLDSDEEQFRLRECLRPQRDLYSATHFVKKVREIVSDFLDESG